MSFIFIIADIKIIRQYFFYLGEISLKKKSLIAFK